jgi:hypothetical protein
LGPYTGWDGAPSNNEPKRNHVRTYEYTDTVSYFAGKHDVKMGFQLYHDTVGFNNGGTTQGTFDFEGIYTGDAYADYLLGVPEDVSRDGGVPLQGFYDNDPSLFVQDNYRLTRNLTLNLGLRWDSTSFYNAGRGQFAAINLATGQLIIPSNFDPTAQPISAQLVPLYKDRYVTSGSLGLPESLMRPDRSFAPRVGFAWAPFGSDKWAVRAGYGIYHPFIENDLVNNKSVDPPIEAYEDYFNDSPPLAPTRTWANFFQGEPLAGSANPSPGQLCPGTNFSFLSCSTPSIWAGTYGSQSGEGVQEYNFTLQRQLTSKVSLTLAYVGNTTSHEGHADSPNDPAPGPGDIQPRRPLEQWGPTTYTRYNQTANYNSLQFSVVSRNWHGLTMLGNYTWSKCLDRGNDDSGWSTLMLPLEYGPCDNSRINASAISYDYQLPFGRGRYFLHNASGWANQVLGGWEVSGVLTLQSGLPYTVQLSGDVANTGVGGQVPNVIGAPIQPRTTSCWFYDSYNPACQALEPHIASSAPNFLALPAQYTYGNESRNSLFGPGLREFDFAVLKRFPITESKSLEFRAEFFDLPNHSNLSNPDSTLDSSAAGTISSTALPDRQIEFALKFFF